MLLGIIADRYLQYEPVVYGIMILLGGAGVLLLVLLLPRGRTPARAASVAVLVALAAGGTGGLLHFADQRRVPASSIEPYLQQAPVIASVRGTVASPPRVLDSSRYVFRRWSFGQDRTAFLLDLESVAGSDGGWIPATGLMRVTVSETVLDLRGRERLELVGRLYPFPPPSNPGAFDWRSRYRRQGVCGGMRCNDREAVVRLDDALIDTRPSQRDRLRSTLRGWLIDDLTTAAGEEASLLQAMILGHRSQTDRKLNETFIHAGCVHFLAVSGVHLVIVMFLARSAVRLFSPRRSTEIWAMTVAVAFYLLVAEPRPPILRASIIALIFCIACFLGRQRARLNWISATVIVLALVKPGMVFDVGYQLSSAAVLGVSYLSPAVGRLAGTSRDTLRRLLLRRTRYEEQLLEPSGNNRRRRLRLPTRALGGLLRYLGTALAISIGAWLAALPVVMVHFGRVHPWGPVNTVVVMPLVTVVLALGFSKLLLTAVSPALGSLLGGPLAAVDSLLIRTVEHLSELPGATIGASAPPWWLIALYYVFLTCLAFRLPRRPFYLEAPFSDDRPILLSPASQRLTVCTLIALMALIGGLAAWSWPNKDRRSERLIATTLDVGNGSCTVLELPDGKTVLYDAGGSVYYDVGRSTILPYLRHRGIDRIDAVYLSHANLDHFNGLPSVMDEFAVGSVFVSTYFEPHSRSRTPSGRLLELLEGRGRPVEVLPSGRAAWQFGGAVFEQLWPAGPFDETLKSNDAAVVMRISFKGHSILLTGDIEDRAQRMLLERGDLGADVLLLPHHGGVVSSTEAFLRAVGSSYLVRSSNQPISETRSGLTGILRRLACDEGDRPRFLNTADHGAAQIVIGRDGIAVSSCLRREL
ncbi:MAG: ComEC/Rec2 family competence protein [Phycisphaerales bacterium]|nr:MAG: ComEC/Rec2 family competence protein [Phycisphaerales bacterium]